MNRYVQPAVIDGTLIEDATTEPGANGDGTLADRHRIVRWEIGDSELPVGRRLVYPECAAELDGIAPWDGIPTPPRDPGDGRRRIVVVAVGPSVDGHGRQAWEATVENPGLGRDTLMLTGGLLRELGFRDATELLEVELFAYRHDDGSWLLWRVPGDDVHTPGGLPDWYTVIVEGGVWAGVAVPVWVGPVRCWLPLGRLKRNLPHRAPERRSHQAEADHLKAACTEHAPNGAVGLA